MCEHCTPSILAQPLGREDGKPQIGWPAEAIPLPTGDYSRPLDICPDVPRTDSVEGIGRLLDQRIARGVEVVKKDDVLIDGTSRVMLRNFLP